MSLVGICAIAIGLICSVLVVHSDYEDGLVGRASLGVVIVGALVVVLSEIAGYSYTEAPHEIQFLLVGNAVFMGRHLYRFLHFRSAGKFRWKQNVPLETH